MDNINHKALARLLSEAENFTEASEQYLVNHEINTQIPVIGITGAPGVGKSTLVNSLLNSWLDQNLQIAVVAVDPSSPFHSGAILGDRVRMSSQYTNPNIYIRSLSNRGALGGLSNNIVPIIDTIRTFPFDKILIETVGVGQSEIDIMHIADLTNVILVPEGGDDVQYIKSGIMEIADILLLNKSDRPKADIFFSLLNKTLTEQNISKPILKTCAISNEGILEWTKTIDKILNNLSLRNKNYIRVKQTMNLIAQKSLKKVDVKKLTNAIEENARLNIYKWVSENY